MARKHLDIESKKWYANQALKWCKRNFGHNNRKRTNMLFELSDRPRTMKNHIVYGNYCFYKNKMTIYLPNNNTTYDIVSTVIHEYTHYLQSRTKYRWYEQTYYYSQNPLEKQAKRNEYKYTKMCTNEIKKLIQL